MKDIFSLPSRQHQSQIMVQQKQRKLKLSQQTRQRRSKGWGKLITSTLFLQLLLMAGPSWGEDEKEKYSYSQL